MKTTITMTSPSNACPKCNGSGKVGYRRANGVCFRCDGLGFISTSRHESDATIAAIKARPALWYITESESPAIEVDENWLENLYAQ